MRALPGVDEIGVDAWRLPPNRAFTVYAARGNQTTALMSVTSNSRGDFTEALAYVDFYANHYDRVILRPASSG